MCLRKGCISILKYEELEEKETKKGLKKCVNLQTWGLWYRQIAHCIYLRVIKKSLIGYGTALWGQCALRLLVPPGNIVDDSRICDLITDQIGNLAVEAFREIICPEYWKRIVEMTRKTLWFQRPYVNRKSGYDKR